jgi:AmmeMemoRadiSam system protein B
MMHTDIRPDAVRPPAVAGLFYPADPLRLSADIDEMFRRCEGKAADGRAVTIVSPHAGYAYSGQTAAEGFIGARDGSFDVVVVISPSHREYFDGVSIYPGGAYSTPLGELPVDAALRRALTEDGGPIVVSGAGHGAEHAVEVQLPFVLSLFGRVPILPIVMGDQRRELCYLLGERLASCLAGRAALIVASTDLSHHHPATVAREIDDRFIDLLARFDCGGLMAGLEDGSLEACGGGPTVAALLAASALGAGRIEVRHRCNSGDTGGPGSSVVGYVSAVATA